MGRDRILSDKMMCASRDGRLVHISYVTAKFEGAESTGKVSTRVASSIRFTTGICIEGGFRRDWRERKSPVV